MGEAIISEWMGGLLQNQQVYVEWLWTATTLSTDRDREAKTKIRSLGAIDQALDVFVDKVGTNPRFGQRSIAIHMLLEEYAAKLPQVRSQSPM
jgi:hypothetical protein